MMFKPMAMAVVLGLLSGCALGIDGSAAPRASFEVNSPVDAVLAIAQSQARLCLTGKDAYHVTLEPGGNAQSASVVVRAPFTSNDIARVDVSNTGGSRTRVDVVMWGRSIWDADAVQAMQDAITFNVVSCKAYMPRSTPKS